MSIYNPPLTDINFVLKELVDFDQLCTDLSLSEVNMELASVVVAEAGKLAAEVLAPLNAEGDKTGARLTEQGVQESPGFADAYQQYVENGWGTLTAPEQFGGQALPNCLGTAVNELWHSANMAFALCPMLGQGAVEALIAHGSPELQDHYLPRLISGEWTGTMNLTEPSAGSDLSAVSSKAVPEGDHYRISGQKIFITWGDHQMTPNIIHLVLARLPDAPAGVKGISLFIVPKFLLDESGEPAELNDAKCISIEHKLGIHASPTCTMSFGDNGGAIGYLVGEPNRGLSYMFTMMNHARQSVGGQGLSISERAYQQAVAYAKERLQGSRPDGSKIPIIEHPDVRRMLMAMRSGTEAMRALGLIASAATDQLHAGESDAQAKVDLYTPIVKGWMTELAQEICSLNVQVHGGMGFVEETGAAQHFRDARILPIYEGTNGIQALDLAGRKTIFDQGKAVKKLFAEIGADLGQLSAESGSEFQVISTLLNQAFLSAQESVDLLLDRSKEDRTFASLVAYDYLMSMGYLLGGWLLVRSAMRARELQHEASDYSESYLTAKISTAAFYAEYYLPRVLQHGLTLKTGLVHALTLDDEQF